MKASYVKIRDGVSVSPENAGLEFDGLTTACLSSKDEGK